MKLMLEQLQNDPLKIPSPSRNEIMCRLLQAWETLEIDTKREFVTIREKHIRRVRSLSCVG